MSVDLLAHFPAGFTPRPEQARLLASLADALAEIEEDRRAPRVLLLEAPPGVGKSHIAMTLARWSGDAYLLTSQKMLQDQYEREFGGELALVKGRDNYSCERYPAAVVPTSRGACRRPRGPACACPYVRAKQAAVNSPVFCTNTAYFGALRARRDARVVRRPAAAAGPGRRVPARAGRARRAAAAPAGRDRARARRHAAAGPARGGVPRVAGHARGARPAGAARPARRRAGAPDVLPRGRGPRVDRALPERARRRAVAGAAHRGRHGPEPAGRMRRRDGAVVRLSR